MRPETVNVDGDVTATAYVDAKDAWRLRWPFVRPHLHRSLESLQALARDRAATAGFIGRADGDGSTCRCGCASRRERGLRGTTSYGADGLHERRGSAASDTARSGGRNLRETGARHSREVRRASAPLVVRAGAVPLLCRRPLLPAEGERGRARAPSSPAAPGSLECREQLIRRALDLARDHLWNVLAIGPCFERFALVAVGEEA